MATARIRELHGPAGWLSLAGEKSRKTKQHTGSMRAALPAHSRKVPFCAPPMLVSVRSIVTIRTGIGCGSTLLTEAGPHPGAEYPTAAAVLDARSSVLRPPPTVHRPLPTAHRPPSTA